MDSSVVFVLLSLTLLMLFFLPSTSPSRVITVAKTGSADYRSVSEAVASIRESDGSPVTVKIGPGVYYERVHIVSGTQQVIFLGYGKDTLIIHDTAGVIVGTFDSWTVLVEADDFIAENVAFANNASNYEARKAGQSVALDIRGDRATLRWCYLYGAQDTFYTGSHRIYVSDSYINGSADSIFGEGAAVFEKSIIEITSYVTAHKGNLLLQTKYLFDNCTIRPPSNRPYVVHETYLGRPWACYAWVIYKSCYLGDLISPLGWWDWGKNESCLATVNYDEYASEGPGDDPSKRVAWSHQLTEQEAKKFTSNTVLSGWVPPNPITTKSSRRGV